MSEVWATKEKEGEVVDKHQFQPWAISPEQCGIIKNPDSATKWQKVCGLPASADIHQEVKQSHGHCWHSRVDASSYCCKCEDLPHIPQPPAKTLEQLAGELAAEIHYAAIGGGSQLQEKLIAFAEEIKRSSIEP